MSKDDRIILLVEDNADDAKLTTRALQRNRVSNPVHVACDGVEALDFLNGTGEHAGRKGAPLPTLVILDLKLPRVDGVEVLRRIRADPRLRLLPVVILTSSREEEDVITSYSLGANGYVRKPVDFNEFLETARIIGLYWLMVNQPPPLGPRGRNAP